MKRHDPQLRVSNTRSRRPKRRHLSPAVAFVAAILVLHTVAGCYQIDSGDTDEDVPARSQPAAASANRVETEPDLPGDIPPAVGDAGPYDASTPGVASEDGGDDRPEGGGATAFAGAASRGQYLTEQVAMCVECHSPKDDHGSVIPSRKFHGSPIPVRSPYAREWAIEAPALAGLDFYTREELVRLLTQGIARDGRPPQPPMPPFRMTPEDASAIYDYLSSLPPAN